MAKRITNQEMEKAVRAFRTEGIHTDYSNIITILMGIANEGYAVVHEDNIVNMINDLNERIELSWADGYQRAEADMSEKVCEAYWQGYNEAKEQYDIDLSDEDFDDEPADIDDDFGFDPYMGCYTYDC